MTVLEQITEMLHEEDPVGMAQYSRDEYEPEAKVIMERYQDTGDLKAIAAMVHQVFVEMFDWGYDSKDRHVRLQGPSATGSVDDYTRIAERLRAIFCPGFGSILMTYPPELEQAVAERLAVAYDKADAPRQYTPIHARRYGWLAVAREALAIRDEAVMEAAKKVRDAVLLHVLALRILGPVAKEQLGEAGFDDAALARIIDLTPALETMNAEEGE